MHNIIIETERLILRPMTVADAKAMFEWVSDERVSKYMVYNTYTSVEQVEEYLKFVEKDDDTYNFGFVRKSDNKLIGSGDIGLRENKTWGKSSNANSKEIWGFGYNFRCDCWGNGFATEAVKGMMKYMHENFDANYFYSSHAEPNLASGNVMKKCGLHFVRYGEFKKLDGSCKMRSMEYEGNYNL
ncbi:MAG: GNAT family N-acetyltransferase [Acutalibacteraceae bacterium]|nr:GNAT family N-acetyltransferase [Acutalibacteraceae bacterium]